MTDWINKIVDEEIRRKDDEAQAAKEVKQIEAASRSLMKDLESRVQRDVVHSNKELYGSAKVFEVRHDMGIYDQEKTNDFVAMTSDYPSATM